MKRILSFVLMLVLGAGLAFAQNTITVTGTVVDEQNVPMIGVAVIQQGTSNGISTDIDGKYSLTVPRGANLEFSFIGYTTQTIPANQAVINVEMAPSADVLTETVVIGYGVQRKSDVTGAISQVKAADIENRSITDVQGALQGKTAGVQLISLSGAPGSESSMRIRGYSSNSSSDPLYVVDGLRTKNISSLDPNDIESMEVLKDAASAAIYGAQAGNGVVLITTKKAAEGRRIIRYDTQISIQDMVHIPKALNSKDYLTWVREGNLVSENIINQFYDGHTDTDWADVAFEHGLMQRHNLSFQGANNNGSLYASVSYLDNNGPVIGDQDIFKRLTATVNASYKIKPWLKFTTTNSFSYGSNRAVRAGGMASLPASVIQMDPLTPVIYPANNLPAHMQSLVDQGHIFVKDENGDYYSMSPFQESNNVNPYIHIKYSDPNNESFNLRGTTSLDLTPIKHVTFTSRLGYDIRSNISKTVTWPNVTNTDTVTDYVTINASAGTNTYWQWENFVNYNQTFARKHNVNVMAGMSYSYRANFNVVGQIAGTGLDNIGITKLDPNYAYFENQTGTATKTVSGGEKRNYAELSYFGRASYDYDNKYYIQASLRADAADLSILPLNTRWGYFPAVSAGWTISRENWFRDMGLTPVSHLKLRASWGQNGSIAGLSNYMYAATIASTIKLGMDPGVGYATGSIPNAIGNYQLKWETSEQIDVGLDLRMFKDRLAFTYDFFDKKTKDLIMPSVTSSLVVGGTLSPINAGNVRNVGHEFELTWKDRVGGFNYTLSGNVATLKNEVTYIYETLTRVSGGSGGSGITTYFEKGFPIWYMRGYEYAGVNPENGTPKFVDHAGNGETMSDDDKVMIGSGIPKLTYGFTINLGYKGFDLVAFGSGAYGNSIAYAIPRSTRSQANTLQYIFDNRWQKPGDNTLFPSAKLQNWDYATFLQSNAYVFDGSYFKVKQLQLGYSFPKKWLEKINVSTLRIYVSLDDWFVFTKYPGFDPEVSVSTNGLGIDYGQYPTIKKTVFGLNISF
ncbi:MAG: TonB-dependent receptor [Bacteroidales bacterium]|nr:TonB-dependent receptor [Bacteroidales bacterium]